MSSLLADAMTCLLLQQCDPIGICVKPHLRPIWMHNLDGHLGQRRLSPPHKGIELGPPHPGLHHALHGGRLREGGMESGM